MNAISSEEGQAKAAPPTSGKADQNTADDAKAGHAKKAEAVRTESRKPDAGNSGNASDAWKLYEVFIRPRRGVNHSHVGSIHAPDSDMALRNARDLYTRRQEGVSIWVVASNDITANSPDEKDSYFDPAGDKIYRHPTFYDVPEGVQM